MNDDRRLRTWVERISAIVIIASVAALAVPKYASLQRERVAAQMLMDVDVLRAAVYAFYSDSAYFPEPSLDRPAPENLVQYLPVTFSFQRPYGAIEYRNWAMRGAPTGIPAPNVIGATVTVRDERIGAMAVAKAQQRTARFVVGNKYTFLFFGT